jgi:hypothetical protein
MESSEIRKALREADRAEAAPWTDYPPTPRWYPPAVGIWAALLTLAFTELDGGVQKVTLLGLVAAELGFLRWYVRHRNGVMPTGRPPREFRSAIARFVTAATGVVLGVAVLAATVGSWAAAAFALVATTPAIAWYERAYADAARRAHERLA